MPRQTFLHRESFLDGTEKQTRETLFLLPAYVSHIRLLAENKVLDTLRFEYTYSEKGDVFLVDVTVLALNDQYTRVSLHAFYANEHTFYQDSAITVGLHDFESLIHAVLKDDLSHYRPLFQKHAQQGWWQQSLAFMRSAMGWFVLRKKLS